MPEDLPNISEAIEQETKGIAFGKLVVEVSMEIQNGKVVMATLRQVSREVKVKLVCK